MEIKNGYKVKVEYEGRFPEGEVFDSTEKHGGEPLEFVPGTGMLVPGFEKAVIGMKSGETKEVTLEPEEAYGHANPEFIQDVPKANFPPEAKEGMLIGLPMPNGQQIPAKIVEIGEETVKLDMNSPMAGKTLVFKIKVVGIEEGDFANEMAQAHEHESDGCCGSGECASDKEEGESCCKDKEDGEDPHACPCC